MLLYGCKYGQTNSNVSSNFEINTLKNESFEDFHLKFLIDSTFRYSRINFPVKGYNSDSEASPENYLWERGDWDFYFEVDKDYKKNGAIVSEIYPTDSTTVWRLYIENSGYDIRYHFKKDNDKWMLTYYSYKNW